MTSRAKLDRLTGVAAAAVIAALGFGAMILAPTPAEAAVFVGFGFGFPIAFPGYYYPSYPYYPPPPPPYYPPPAYYPPPPVSFQPSAGHAPSGLAATPPITYTSRRGWTNAEGQYCREYKSNQGIGNRATERYGTACRDPSGQWRVVN